MDICDVQKVNIYFNIFFFYGDFYLIILYYILQMPSLTLKNIQIMLKVMLKIEQKITLNKLQKKQQKNMQKILYLLLQVLLEKNNNKKWIKFIELIF